MFLSQGQSSVGVRLPALSFYIEHIFLCFRDLLVLLALLALLDLVALL